MVVPHRRRSPPGDRLVHRRPGCPGGGAPGGRPDEPRRRPGRQRRRSRAAARHGGPLRRRSQLPGDRWRRRDRRWLFRQRDPVPCPHPLRAHGCAARRRHGCPRRAGRRRPSGRRHLVRRCARHHPRAALPAARRAGRPDGGLRAFQPRRLRRAAPPGGGDRRRLRGCQHGRPAGRPECADRGARADALLGLDGCLRGGGGRSRPHLHRRWLADRPGAGAGRIGPWRSRGPGVGRAQRPLPGDRRAARDDHGAPLSGGLITMPTSFVARDRRGQTATLGEMTNDAAARARTSIHLVPHTHWDREWYRPFQSFRMQLVDLVDRVLEMLEADPDFAFTLDGQLATIDDYLEIRPEQTERIAGHVRSGRLAIGPWQILMDEFLVSGETLVRNLEMGWARAEELGGPMKVGYLPDMFGHVAQMPQILRNAGLADAVVWRGVPATIDRHAFRWESPDGSWVRAEYLPSGYGNAANLFAVPERLDAAAERFLDWAEPWFGTDPVLAMYGTDHAAPVPELAALVGRLNEVQEASSMRISTLAEYLAEAPPLTPDAPCWRGEMRSGARANVLMGVASARIDIKRAAGRAETLLERYAEPLTALHVTPDAWPAAFLRLAWRKVIENSAHDSICGCSVDPVGDQVLVRFAEAEQIGSTLARRAALARSGSVPRGSVTVLNPTPSRRSALIEAELAIPDDWTDVALELPDGTRAGTQELARKEALLFEQTLRGDEVDDIFRRFHGREIFDHAWNGYRIDGRTITFEVDNDPDPVWLDVDGLRAEVTAAMRATGGDEWRARIGDRARRTLAATAPGPALGWTAVR